MPERPFCIMNVVGARPNMMKMAPLFAEMQRMPEFEPLLVHTGQHYDYCMSQVFFEQLNLPEPDYNLEVGGGTHHHQTAEIMKRFGERVRERRPDLIVVVGDVNSTMACALVGAKEMIPVAHVEAGLRSFDRSMPEELNRIVTDSVSDLLFTTEASAAENLQREGVPDAKIFFVGNLMIDSLVHALEEARQSPLRAQLGVSRGNYIVLTLHRPANVDDCGRLVTTLLAVAELAREIPVIFPVHPRTKERIAASGFSRIKEWQPGVECQSGIVTIPPASYLDFIGLVDGAAMVITDSGGIQEETTYLGVHCLTFRDNTERPVTITHGTNHLIGTSPELLLREAGAVLRNGNRTRGSHHVPPPLWDGKAAGRVVTVLREVAGRRTRAFAGTA